MIRLPHQRVPIFFKGWAVVAALTAWIPPLLVAWAVLRWWPR